MTPQRWEKHPLLPPPHVNETLPVQLVCPKLCVCKPPGIVFHAKNIQQDLHLGRHVWLQ